MTQFAVMTFMFKPWWCTGRMTHEAMLSCCLLALAIAVSGITSAGEEAAKLPAFPGAEGFGCQTPGGRGGRVIRVTNLKTSGPGSLQWACNQKGPRIVVFEVSGVIKGDIIIKHGQDNPRLRGACPRHHLDAILDPNFVSDRHTAASPLHGFHDDTQEAPGGPGSSSRAVLP